MSSWYLFYNNYLTSEFLHTTTEYQILSSYTVNYLDGSALATDIFLLNWSYRQSYNMY